MEAREIERRLLEHYGIRVDAEMTRYVARRLTPASRALRELPVIGGAARTGRPLRVMIDPAAMQQAAT